MILSEGLNNNVVSGITVMLLYTVSNIDSVETVRLHHPSSPPHISGVWMCVVCHWWYTV